VEIRANPWLTVLRFPASKAKDKTCGQTEVVLRGAEEAGLHVVRFGAQSQDADDFIVQASAHCSRQRRVAGGDSLSRVHMADAERKRIAGVSQSFEIVFRALGNRVFSKEEMSELEMVRNVAYTEMPKKT